jgi:acyl-[acyl-carrier-protein] desaturase
MSINNPKIIKEIEEQRPRTPAGLLSHDEKDRIIEKGFLGPYRWYISRSQKTRNWNPNNDFEWREFRTDHSEKLNLILEGYFAIEQYVPDFVLQLLKVLRKSYGRSHFHIRWGAEEEKHSDLWLNSILFSRHRSPKWIEEYKHTLREKQWELPWDNAMHMIFYTVVQERATQVNYLNTAKIARGEMDDPDFANDSDPVLASIAQVIATDEAAHYNFFLEGARLFLYYYPAQSIEALYDVIKFFAMPAGDLIPDYDKFAEVVARACIYGPREHLRDVLEVAIKSLSIKGKNELYKGIKRIRSVPKEDGTMQDTSIFDMLDYEGVTTKVQRLHDKISDYEKEIGINEIDPTSFVPSGIKHNGSG